MKLNITENPQLIKLGKEASRDSGLSVRATRKNSIEHGICKESNCKEKAVIDYNGHGYWVCKYHHNKLSDNFDEEYY